MGNEGWAGFVREMVFVIAMGHDNDEQREAGRLLDAGVQYWRQYGGNVMYSTLLPILTTRQQKRRQFLSLAPNAARYLSLISDCHDGVELRSLP